MTDFFLLLPKVSLWSCDMSKNYYFITRFRVGYFFGLIYCAVDLDGRVLVNFLREFRNSYLLEGLESSVGTFLKKKFSG